MTIVAKETIDSPRQRCFRVARDNGIGTRVLLGRSALLSSHCPIFPGGLLLYTCRYCEFIGMSPIDVIAPISLLSLHTALGVTLQPKLFCNCIILISHIYIVIYYSRC